MRKIIIDAWRSVAGLLRPSPGENTRKLEQRDETLESLRIREATPDDISALARLHVVTWNDTYAPFGMKGPGVQVREAQWREAFERRDEHWFCYVVQNRTGKLIEFAQANRSDHPGYGGELRKIYLRRDYQRLGVGRRLIKAVATRFLELGVTSMWLYGDARNPSNRAWRALGAKKTDDDPGNGNYGWTDLQALTEQLDAV